MVLCESTVEVEWKQSLYFFRLSEESAGAWKRLDARN